MKGTQLNDLHSSNGPAPRRHRARDPDDLAPPGAGGDTASVLTSLKPFLATREDAWLYRSQMSLVVDGYNDDPREFVDIPQVRDFLISLEQQWPYWAFFFNLLDDSMKLLGACVCAADFRGGGAVEIDGRKLADFLQRGFAGMNTIFDRHSSPEAELQAMSLGIMEVIEQAGMS